MNILEGTRAASHIRKSLIPPSLVPIICHDLLAVGFRFSRLRCLCLSDRCRARYGQWTLGFADPPLALEAWNRKFEVSALKCRGRPFLPTIFGMLKATSAVSEVKPLDLEWQLLTPRVSKVI